MGASYFFRVVRWLLRRWVLFYERAFAPKALVRSPEAQKSIDEACRKLALYQFEACPFCVKVRHQMKRLSLPIELRDAKNDSRWKDELTREGGDYQTPCLRIEDGDQVRWLYESSAINAYLAEKFGQEDAGAPTCP